MSDGRPLHWRATGWLCLLGASFFLLYGLANEHAAHEQVNASLAFDWERRIPFWPSFMLPYMSEDLFYAISLFIVGSKRELDRHALRLLLTTLVAVLCFWLMPFRFAFARPEVTGINGWLLGLLNGFDQPYNQAPSLHIALLVLLWKCYGQHVTGLGWRLLQLWFVAIGASVLFVWQHHVLDVIWGFALGVAVLYVLPDEPWRRCRPTRRHWRLAAAYGGGALGLSSIAALYQGFAWWLLWPAVSLSVVAAGYSTLGSAIFQKSAQGHRSFAATIMLAPYLVAAAGISRRLRKHRAAVRLGAITIAPWPGTYDLNGTVLDLTGELPRGAKATTYCCVPLLDLVPPAIDDLDRAVCALRGLDQAARPLTIHCALGLERSVAVALAWLLATGKADSPDSAATAMRQAHPQAKITPETMTTLRSWYTRYATQTTG